MIITSTLVMFGLMYLNTFAANNIWFSQTRIWMALYTGAAMAAVMLSFMLGMYRNTRLNAAIFVAAALVFAGSLYLVRSQDTVGDEAWTKAMIPHHSIAIMTSARANISDPRTRNPADDIIEWQSTEIAETGVLIADLNGGPTATPEIDSR